MKLYKSEIIDQRCKDKYKKHLKKAAYCNTLNTLMTTKLIRKCIDEGFFEKIENISGFYFCEYLLPWTNKNMKEEEAEFLGQNLFPAGSPELAIKTDDLNALQALAADPKFDPNKKMYSEGGVILKFERNWDNIWDGQMNVLGAEEDENIVECAVCGGNLEIIRLVVDDNFDARYIRREVVDWAFEKIDGVMGRKKAANGLLSIAAESNDFFTLLRALDNRAQLSYRGKEKNQLQLAAQNGHLAMVRLLAASDGCDLNYPHLDAPLSLACEGGHGKIVQFLLRAGADPRVESKCHCTPLWFAAKSGSALAVRELLAAGAVLNRQDVGAGGFTPWLQALRFGRLEIARLLEPGSDIHRHANDNTTAMHFAASRDDPELIRYCLDLGLGTSETTKADGFTPYLLAVDEGLERSKAFFEECAAQGRKVDLSIPKSYKRVKCAQVMNLYLIGRKKLADLSAELAKYKTDPTILIGEKVGEDHLPAEFTSFLSRYGLELKKKDYIDYVITKKKKN